MKPLINSLFALALVAGPGLAQENVKAQLRELAEMPTTVLTVTVSLRGGSSLGIFPVADRPSIVERAARLEKKLRSRPHDAERYCELGHCYVHLDQPDRARQAYEKAAAICREKMKARSKDKLAPIILGRALAGLGTKDAEKILRKAVLQAPEEWRGWVALGDFLEERAYAPVLKHKFRVKNALEVAELLLGLKIGVKPWYT